MSPECNVADNDGRCTADDGERCPRCAASLAAEEAYYRARWVKATPEEKKSKSHPEWW